MTYDYLIAGMHLRCRLPFQLHIEEESREFLLEPEAAEGHPDVVLELKPVEKILLPEDRGTSMINSYYRQTCEGLEVYHCPGPGRKPHVRLLWSREEPKLLRGEYVSSMEERICYSGDILNLLGLEILLLRHEALLLHASFVRFEGKGILFSGPSGVGKSTQARLWQEHQGAETVNGDRAALRKNGEVWTAWGLPYAGSSGIYRNDSAPVAAIVVLRQGQENSLRPLSASEALRSLYPEIMIHRWDRAFVEKAMDLALALFAEVPVWLLECRPDKQATELLKQSLVKEGRL